MTNFKKALQAQAKSLEEHHKTGDNKTHIIFDKSAVVYPEGITEDSLKKHDEFIGDLTNAVGYATSSIGRRLYNENKEHDTVTGELKLGHTVIQTTQSLSETPVTEDGTEVADFTNVELYTSVEHHFNKTSQQSEGFDWVVKQSGELAKDLFTKKDK